MNFAEQLKSQLDIVRVVGGYVRLRKQGARHVGLCPFHTEKTPSFSVNPQIGIFICFGCGVKGDVLKFVQEMEQLTFPETLQLLAERNGIPMPAPRQQDPEADLRAAVMKLHEIALEQFRSNLFDSAASDVRQYLGGRGLNQSLAETFGLGYSDRSGQDLIRKVRSDFSPSELDGSGLFGRREDGTFYDRFRGRLMFPIHNESGKPIAFGGRALKADEEPKYLNSPETLVYKKSLTLYNLHRAKESVRRQDQVILVEGYMDVIGAYAAGVRCVVASCGTSLTQQQVRAMKRHTQNVVVNFDSDAAGANAAERSLQLLLEEGLHVKVLELDGGLDPDEYVREHGAEQYLAQISRASRYFIWLADRARKKFDMSSAEARAAGFQELLLPAIRRISDRIERAAVAAEVAQYLGVDLHLILSEFRKTSEKTDSRQSGPSMPDVSVTERILVSSLIASEEVREILLPQLSTSLAARRYAVWPVLEVLLELAQNGYPVSYAAVESGLEEAGQRLLSAIFFADNREEVLTREQAIAFARILAAEEQRLEIEAVRSKLKQAERSGNNKEAFQLFEQLNRLQTRREP